MNRSPLMIALVSVFLTGTAWAQGETDPAQELAEQYAAEKAARKVREARLAELMGTMAREMDAIRNAKSGKERESLMTTHKASMREAMSLMRGIGGTHMREVMGDHMASGMGQHKADGGPNHQHKRMAPSRPRADMSDAQRLTDLENRVDMMQVMMESLMNDFAKR